jgi:hypothetical protein
MAPGIEEAAIGGAVSGLATRFMDRLFALTGEASGKRSSLAGKWHCCWTVEQPVDYRPPRIDDLVTLKVDRKGNVTGRGENPFYGEYSLVGTDGAVAVTLMYRGTGSGQHHPGVCLLLKSSDTECEGVWWQHGSSGGLVGGSVALRKKG